MRCWTLHSNQELLLGIPVSREQVDADKWCWTIHVGSPAPLGVFETNHFPIIDQNRVNLDPHGVSTLDFVGYETGYHMVLIKNQSPTGGAWAMEKMPGVEIISSGYAPTIRGSSQGEGAEYLLQMKAGSHVLIALAGSTRGRPKQWVLKASEGLLTMQPYQRADHEIYTHRSPQVPLLGNGKPWPK